MTFVEFFDPNNPTHIEAYLYLLDKGYWPIDFATDVDQSDRHHWHVWVVSSLANAWLEYFEFKQKVKTQFIPTINTTNILDTKKLSDLVIKEINKRICAKGVKIR
jgi:hypothetical protein